MSTFAQGTIEMDAPTGKIQELIDNTPEGVEFKGGIEEGDFKVEEHGIEGIYRSTDNGDGTHHFRVTLTKKPWYVTVEMVENKLKEFLDKEPSNEP